MREILSTPAALRLHVTRQFPDYAWESAECIASLRRDSKEKDRLLSIILDAQDVIADLPMGGIGSDGPTMEHITKTEQTGYVVDNDASYHQGQKAWLILNRAIAAEKGQP